METPQTFEMEIHTIKPTLALTLGDSEVIKVAKAISSGTRQTILQHLNREPMDVSKIAQLLDQTEANISAQIKILEKAGLVVSHYEPGGHGVRKICEPAFQKIEIVLF